MQLYKSAYGRETTTLLKRSRMQSTLVRQSPLVWHLLSWLEAFAPDHTAATRLVEIEEASHHTADGADAWRLFTFADRYITTVAPIASDRIGSPDAQAFATSLREATAQLDAYGITLPQRIALHGSHVQMWDVEACYLDSNKSRDRGDFEYAADAERQYEQQHKHEIILRNGLQTMLNSLGRFHRFTASTAYHRHACRADWYSEVPQFEPSYKWPPLGRLLTWPLTNLEHRGDTHGLSAVWTAQLDTVASILTVPHGVEIPIYQDAPRPERQKQPAHAPAPSLVHRQQTEDIPF